MYHGQVIFDTPTDMFNDDLTSIITWAEQWKILFNPTKLLLLILHVNIVIITHLFY